MMKADLFRVAALLLVAVFVPSARAEYNYFAGVGFEEPVNDAPRFQDPAVDLDYFTGFGESSYLNESGNSGREIAVNGHSGCDGCDGDGCARRCSHNCDCCCRRMSLYGSFNMAGTFMHMRQGGFNTVGAFSNEGFSANADTFDLGGALGIAIPRGRGTLRLETQVMFHDVLDSVTGSFPGFPNTPTFFYTTNIEDRWSVMANAWYDIPLGCRPIEIYFGGGLGASGGDLSVSDGVVQGADDFTEFTWQVGAGITYHRGRRLSIDLGYRYVDFGTADVPLAGGAAPAGNFTMDMTAHQITMAFRYNHLGDLLCWR